MLRVREQVGCTDELTRACGNRGITIAMLDTGVAFHRSEERRVGKEC